VPVAVTVTSAETLNRAKIRDIADLASVVPSLRVNEHQLGQHRLHHPWLRQWRQQCGRRTQRRRLHRWRLPLAQRGADRRLPRCHQVEVLRGPQSTLFGKNASAGVVSISTQEPQFKTQGSAELSYGNYNAFVAKANLTGKVAENLAASIAAATTGATAML
jgi:hypothetical protein